MQVTHVSDHSTHAVIGGKQTIELGVSNSAEFTHILSSTLYTNQKLAVAREVLCNAWDAHIMAGMQDRPIEVTLNDQYLIIRDYGPGIHPDMIGPIYGVYGNSTKKHDGNQTGGFGLGSKAPFAYTDHFEVTSCHEGTKTIYSMAKVAPGVGGKSGITPMVTIPTTESGLTVKIRLLNLRDKDSFENLIKQVVLRGEIFATLNGEVLPVLPLSQTKEGWAIVESLDGQYNTLFVRYGNVIYPIPSHEDYQVDYDAIREQLSRLSNNSGMGRSFIIMAPAHSISVTPSREALSLQHHTVQAVKILLASTRHIMSKCSERVMPEYSRQVVRKILANPKGSIDIYATNNHSLEREAQDSFISRRGELKKNFSLANLRYVHQVGLPILVDELCQAGEIPGYLATTLIKAMKRQDLNEQYALKNWFYQNLLSTMTRGMEKAGLDPKAMRIHRAYKELLCTPREFFNSVHDRVKSKEFLHLATTRVVLCHTPRTSPLSKRQLDNLYSDFDDIDWGTVERAKELVAHPTLVYIVRGRKREDIDAAVAFFTPRCKEVINLVPEYVKPEPKEVIAKPKTVKKVGYVAFSYAKMGNESFNLEAARRQKDDAPRVVNPVSYVLATEITRGWAFGDFHGAKRTVLNLFGDDCAVVTETQKKKLVEAGVPEFSEHVIQSVLWEIENNPKYFELYSHNEDLYTYEGWESKNRVTRYMNMQVLRDHFGVPNPPVLTEREQQFWQIWEQLKRNYYSDRYKPLSAKFKQVKKIGNMQRLISICEKCKGLKAFNSSNLESLITGEYDDPKKNRIYSKHILNALLNVIKEI